LLDRRAAQRLSSLLQSAAGRRPAIPEEEPLMFELVFESLKRATETTIQMQQEAFRKWATLWPGLPAVPGTFAEQAQKFQKKWAEFYEELLKKQRETLEAQFKAGLKHIEEAFRLAETKDPGELRARTVELWQKVFETLRQSYEAQVRDFQALAIRWTEMVTKGAA
jgi:hypothetical protein